MTSDATRTDAANGRQTGRFDLLAVTSFRPAEIRNSTAHMAATTNVVTVDRDASIPRKVREATWKTRRAILEHDPDVLLLDAYGTIGAPVAAVASHYDVRVVARLVSDVWRRLDDEHLSRAVVERELGEYLMYRASRGLTGFALGRATGFVVVSNELRDVVVGTTGVSRDRVGVVPVPVTDDTEGAGSPERARRSLGITEDAVVLTVTNLEYGAKKRGTEQVLAALEPLLREHPDVAYVVAGAGRYYDAFVEELAETIADPAVRERVYAPGFVDDVADLYALADVFVYVSHLDGYPNAVLEAQTAGLPVVANAAHGMRDQITDGETGLLVDDPGNGAIREHVAALLADPTLRRRLGRAARERVRWENSPAVISRRLERFLERFLADE